MSNIIDFNKNVNKNVKRKKSSKKEVKSERILSKGIEKVKTDTLNYYKKICNDKEFLAVVEQHLNDLVFCDLFNANSDVKKMMVQFSTKEDEDEFHRFIINVSKEILVRTEMIIRLELELYKTRNKK